MGILGRIAVPWKMLGRGEDATLRVNARAFDERAHMVGYLARVFSERANINDRVVGIAVDVGYREVYPMNSQGPRIASRNLSHVFRRLRIACRRKRHGVRK